MADSHSGGANRRSLFKAGPGAWILAAIALMYLSVFIIIPFAGIIAGAFRQGALAFWNALVSEDNLSALAISAGITLGTLLIITITGIAAAWLLARFRFPGRGVLLGLIHLPLSLSPVVVGLMFILLLGKNAPLGAFLESFGVRIIFSWPGLLLTSTFICFPYMVREILPVLEEQGAQEEEAGVTLGAPAWQVFLRITLPNIRHAVLYGLTLSGARALGEYGAASVVSGLLRGRTVTLPIQVQIFYAEYMTTAAYASAVVFLLFAVLTVTAKTLLGRKLRSA